MSQLTPEQEAELRALYESTRHEEEGGQYSPVRHEPRFRLLRKLLAPLAVLVAVAWKFKAALVVVFKFKFFVTSASMLVSIAAYALFWGWKFAVGFVLLMLVHELGHVLEARRLGIRTTAPMFIPFLGAAIIPKDAFQNAWQEARLALGGPILGSLGAAGVWVLGEALDSELLVALAFTGFFLNLFNLVPFLPLDGGRIVGALHPALWGLGLAGLAGLLFLYPNPILILVLVLGGLELWHRWQSRHEPELRDYYRLPGWQRGVVAGLYLGLALSLSLAMSASFVERDL